MKLQFMEFRLEPLKDLEKAFDLSGNVSDMLKAFPKKEFYFLYGQLKSAAGY